MSDLVTQTARVGMTYYDYLQNVAKYIPDADPVSYAQYSGHLAASMSMGGSADLFGGGQQAKTNPGLKPTMHQCITGCMNAGKRSLFACGALCRIMSG
jgi:hypothetical protein